MMRSILSIMSFVAVMATAAISVAEPVILPALDATMPQRERDFLLIIGEARAQLGNAGTLNKRANVRIAMQLKLVNFVGADRDVKSWVGIVKEHGHTREGDVWITVEIGPDVTFSTVRELADDPEHVSLIRASSPVSEQLKHIAIGEKIVFSGTLVRYLITSDEEMINRPLILAHFTEIEPLMR